MGVDPKACRGEESPYEWYLQKGSASAVAMLLEISGQAYFEVFCEIMPIPDTNRETFFEELLKINSQIIGTAFSISKDGKNLQMNAIRECEGMDSEEASAIIMRVINNADKYGEKFREEYKKT